MTVEHRGSGQGPVVGRDFELARVGHFLDNITVAPTALLVEGEPGIGKTTVWVAAIAAAEARGFRVLQARAAETEVRLSHAALADLVGADFEATRTALPSVQQRALAAALLSARKTTTRPRPAHDRDGLRGCARRARRDRSPPGRDRRRPVARSRVRRGTRVRCPAAASRASVSS